MFQKIKWQHPLYYVPMIFLIFPLLGIVVFDYPSWTIWLTLLFTLGYLYVTHAKVSFWINLVWLYMLIYVVYMTIFVNGGMMWFFFYFASPIVFRFGDRLLSFRMLTYLSAMLFMVITAILYAKDIGSQIMSVLVPIINLSMMFFWKKELEDEEQRRLIMEKNQQINLLSAENERNRIGRDLHDTLGHTFAMLSLKTELALKQLDKDNLDAVRTELKELNAISTDAMTNVRQLINNLKYRTVMEELDNIREMFALSDIQLSLDNQLDLSTLSPVMQSTMTMILRELTTNIVKHAAAKNCQIKIYRQKKVIIEVSDDGRGFERLTGEELHSIRDRLQLVKGEVVILSRQNPTQIQVLLEEGGQL
ncbi:sensor histidine kinase [Streptococcus plurextorum]|uniref:sensor histidine kinase n=1 Tax=Streptococcus plurextorum TaxID=456876 RepID=UPI0003F5D68C|nr:sensor histidine kinase [Streptococcus plurextorum]